VQHYNPTDTNAREHLKKFARKDPAEANRATQERWKEQILENNRQTKANIALMKKEQGMTNPSSNVLG
jgi:DNA-directed RNA polymerase subunit F